MGILASLSRSGGPLDIKTQYTRESGGVYTPVSLGDRLITTARSLGNIIFGANMRAIHSKSWDMIFTSRSTFYNEVMPTVGAYNQSSNDANGYNSGFPFYGEHTYSGTNIYFGFFGKLPD